MLGVPAPLHEVVLAGVAVARQHVVAPAPVPAGVAVRAVGLLESRVLRATVECVAHFLLLHLLDIHSLRLGGGDEDSRTKGTKAF